MTELRCIFSFKDADALFAQAIDAGAKELEPAEDHVEGDRRGGVMDPFGHIWWIATHIKDVLLEEIQWYYAASKNFNKMKRNRALPVWKRLYYRRE